MIELETMHLGNRYGHDIRLSYPLPKQFGVEQAMNKQLLPEATLCEAMVGRIEPGIKIFDNYKSPVHIYGSELFYIGDPDAIGNRIWRARLYLNGKFTSFGQENPKGWHDQERVCFATVSYTPFEPGQTHARLVDTPLEQRISQKIYGDKLLREKMEFPVLRVFQMANQLRQERIADVQKIALAGD